MHVAVAAYPGLNLTSSTALAQGLNDHFNFSTTFITVPGSGRAPSCQTPHAHQHGAGQAKADGAGPFSLLVAGLRHLSTKSCPGCYITVITDSVLPAPGWLAALLASAAEHQAAGIISPAVMTTQYKLQSAGGSITPDGSILLRGRCQAIEAELSFSQAVHFASPDAMLMRSELVPLLLDSWQGRGLPGNTKHDRDSCSQADVTSQGYQTLEYAAADMGLLVRAAGWEVLYQPLSIVLAASHPGQECQGVPPSALPAAHLAADKQLVMSSWAPELFQPLGHPLASQDCGTDVGTARHRQAHQLEAQQQQQQQQLDTRMHILWVDDIVPEPDKDSGSVRTLALLRFMLQAGHTVSFQPAWDKLRPVKYALQVGALQLLAALCITCGWSNAAILITGLLDCFADCTCDVALLQLQVAAPRVARANVHPAERAKLGTPGASGSLPGSVSPSLPQPRC